MAAIIKKINSNIAAVVTGILLVIVILFITAVLSKYEAVIKDTDGKFYHARALFIAGSALVCRRDTTVYTTKSNAREGKDTTSMFSLFIMKNIEFIEIFSTREEPIAGLPSRQLGLNDYMGDFSVNAAGNQGSLSLRAGKGFIYGTIQFPNWGKGATEYLKNVRIVNGQIYFTRSATTQEEIRRLGASASFVQEYSGEYFRSGNLIKGYYTVYGERKLWDASKIR